MKDNPRPYSVRLPEKLRSKLETVAKNGNRSLHAEILSRLETSLLTETTSEKITRDEIKNIARSVIREELNKK